MMNTAVNKHCEYIDSALDNFLKADITFESVNQITGYLCAYDAFIDDFKDYIEPLTIARYVDKFTKICKKFNIDYAMSYGLITAYSKYEAQE